MTPVGELHSPTSWRGRASCFTEGRPLCQAVRWRLRLELRATWLGGMRILDRIEAGGFDVIGDRPVLRPADVPWFVGRMLTWWIRRGRAIKR